MVKGRVSKRRRLRVESLERRMLLSADVASQFWTSASAETSVPEGRSSFLAARKFESFNFQRSAFESLLSTAPHEDSGTEPLEITLPTPTGDIARFQIVESPVMAAELAAKFPELRTYRGQGIDDPAATVRFDINPNSFHAQVLSPEGSWYIDPVYHLDDSVYASYFRSDLQATAVQPMPEWNLEALSTASLVGPLEFDLYQAVIGFDLASGSELPSANPTSDSPTSDSPTTRAGFGMMGGPSSAPSGTELRTYRIAIAATAEYTSFHSAGAPTVAEGLAGIVTAVNRITGIYENELAIRLELVANNDLLIYTNTAIDPYSNTINAAQLTVNHNNITNVIGSANFDVGHVFATLTGGLANTGVVGNDLTKGRGGTGLSAPIGDPFFVDRAAREIGRQFGAERTFNGDSLSCTASTRVASSAFEPGSGSTIMGQAGICGNDNLQANSDPYFHSISFDQIVTFVDDVIPSIGTRTTTGNNIPTVDAGPDYTIPVGTPFILTASGSDGDAGDQLTYTWEQRDLGPQADLNAADDGQGPLFRSYLPSTNPTRMFPALPTLLGTNIPGEKLPTLPRTMDFRATVRDNRSGGGGVNTDDVVINVIDAGGAFAVTSHNTAQSYPGVSLQTVTWNVAGTTANGIDTATVNILLSLDGGNSFPITLASNVDNDGSHDLVFPGVNTATARLKIEAVGNIFFDISDIDFTIGITELEYLLEDFDGVTAPALPAGWTQTSTRSNTWRTVDGTSDTLPNHAFVSGIAQVSDSRLTSPVISLPPGINEISFENAYNLEETYDGGVFEISINGGAFTDILVAGGSFISGGYDETISVEYGNPLAGRQAWTGDSAGYVYTRVGLPATAFGQDVQFRWRLGTDIDIPFVGWQIDTVVLHGAPIPQSDFGDAPISTYSTMEIDNGAVHGVGGPLFLGALIDAETDGQPNATATGDDEDGIDDEDGVVFTSPLAIGTMATVTVTASVDLGLLNAWVDFNDDGDWADPGEQIFTDLLLVAGENQLEFPVPSDASLNATTFARFRVSSQAGVGFDGPAIDGEVEDYQVEIVDNIFVVESVQFGDGTAQRSLIDELTVTFSGPVDMDPGAIQLFKRGPLGGEVTVSYTPELIGGKTVAVLGFSGSMTRGNGALIDGNYELRIDATKVRTAGTGVLLDGDGDGNEGGDYVAGAVEADDFFAYFGDSGGDRTIGFTDFVAFRNAFGSSSSDPSFNSLFDFEADTVIGFADFVQFRNRFGSTLAFV